MFVYLEGVDNKHTFAAVLIKKPSNMKYVKWIFVVLLISSLTSFVEKDKPTGGLSVGDVAPNFSAMSDKQQEMELSHLRGRCVLLSFWASYDAASRLSNARLSNVLRSHGQENEMEMFSVSLDEYESIFKETVRNDQLIGACSWAGSHGETSNVYKKYRLGRGFTNYLLNEDGVIIAKNLTAEELSAYLR